MDADTSYRSNNRTAGVLMQSMLKVIVSGLGVFITVYTIVPFVTFISYIPYEDGTSTQGKLTNDGIAHYKLS